MDHFLCEHGNFGECAECDNKYIGIRLNNGTVIGVRQFVESASEKSLDFWEIAIVEQNNKIKNLEKQNKIMYDYLVKQAKFEIQETDGVPEELANILENCKIGE